MNEDVFFDLVLLDETTHLFRQFFETPTGKHQTHCMMLLHQHCESIMPHVSIWEQICPNDEIVQFIALLVRQWCSIWQPGSKFNLQSLRKICDDLYAAEDCSEREHYIKTQEVELAALASKACFDLDALRRLIMAMTALVHSSHDPAPYNDWMDEFEPYFVYIGTRQKDAYWQQFSTDIGATIVRLTYYAAHYGVLVYDDDLLTEEMRAKIVSALLQTLHEATEFYNLKAASGEAATELSIEERQMLPVPVKMIKEAQKSLSQALS